ncbi:MAG: thioesterase [Rubrivivax sp.]|nr:MAG: thioesterase [Rubrivivax sp.]
MKPPSSPAPALNLIWCHHAGGHGDSYKAFATWLPPHWQVTFAEYPGRGLQKDLPFERDLTALAEHLFDRLEPRMGAPYALFGHSMGSLVAYEIACVAMKRGHPGPVWLGVSAHRSPTVPVGKRYRLHKLSDAALHQALLALNGTPRLEPDPHYLAMVRADLGACEGYQKAHPPVLNCAMSGYLGDIDPMVSQADMHSWKDLTTHSWRLRTVPGGHFYFGIRHRQFFMRSLVGDIQAALSALPAPAHPPFELHDQGMT